MTEVSIRLRRALLRDEFKLIVGSHYLAAAVIEHAFRRFLPMCPASTKAFDRFFADRVG